MDVSSGSKCWEDWLIETFTSKWGSVSERSPFVTWYSLSIFRDGTGTVPEYTRTRGFKKNSSNSDWLPRMGLSVLLKPSDNFFLQPLRTLEWYESLGSRENCNPWSATRRTFLLILCSWLKMFRVPLGKN